MELWDVTPVLGGWKYHEVYADECEESCTEEECDMVCRNYGYFRSKEEAISYILRNLRADTVEFERAKYRARTKRNL